MNSSKVLKVLSALCAAVLLMAAGTNLLSLAHAEQYHIGDAEISSAIKNLEIDWTSGAVHIAYHSGNTIRISEKTTGVISKDMRMRWCLDGDTLRIEYDQPGFHLFSVIPHDKELTVTLPEGITLEKADIHSTSGGLFIPALRADSVKLKSTSGDIHAAVSARTIKSKLTSGDIELQVMSAAEEITIESTSGDITLESAWAADKTEIDSTSGEIRAAIKQTDEFKVKSTSGDIHAVLGNVKTANIKSTSGKVTVETEGMEKLEIRATSGDVTAYLPTAPGFTAQLETTSGRIDSQMPLTKDGKTYTAGDGSGKVEIHTTSGNVTVCAKEDR